MANDAVSEWLDQRRERLDEIMCNNPEREQTTPVAPPAMPEEKVWTCAASGCDTVLTGDEQFPGWLCDACYSKPENGKWRW